MSGRAERPSGLWWTVGRAAVGSLVRVGFRVRVSGAEHIPRTGGAVLASNHVSVLDPIVVALAAGRRGRSIHYLVVADVFDRPLIGPAMRALEQVPVRRGIGDRVALERLTALVRAGSLGGVSVEGTVGDGAALQPGQKGAARVALAAGCPLIPVGIWGTQERWPGPGFHWGRPLRPAVVAIVGEPIGPVGDARSRADLRDATDSLMEAIGQLVDAAREQQPPASTVNGIARRAARV